MDTFNVGMYDYGVAYNLLWREAFNVASYPSSIGYLTNLNSTKLISFALVPYMRLFPSVYNLLILQSFVIAFSGFGLYFVTKHVTRKPFLGLFVEIIWMLYYPNSAANGYPFHYMTLFPLFYIFGFFFLIKNRVLYASILFSLAALTDLLVPIILLFSIPMFVYSHKRYYKPYKFTNNNIMLSFVAAIIVISSIILFVNYFRGGAVLYSGNVVSANDHVNFVSGVLDKLHKYWIDNFLFILFLLLPLLFSVFFVNYRYFISAIPPLLYYLVGGVNYLRFYYPMQYSSLVSPILFIAFSVFLFKISMPHENRFNILKKFSANGFSFRKRSIFAFLLAILLINVGLFAIYSPISPANQYMKSDFNANPPADGGYGWYKNLSVSNYDSNLMKMMSLIPQNATVLGDFGMPQLANRYYFTYAGQYNPADPIDYAINNPESGFFTVAVDNTYPDFFNYNEMELSNIFLENSSYGVYAQSEGAILFKHDYLGQPVFYKPLDVKVNMNNKESGNLISNTVMIMPGTYNLTLHLKQKSRSTVYIGKMMIGNIIGNTYSTTIKIPFYRYTNFFISNSTASGTLYLNQTLPATDVNLNQNIPPPQVYKTFNSNYSYFSPTVRSVDVNTSSFSYLYEINLTSYEDGLKKTRNIGNDSQIFSMNGAVWNQVGNDGYFEFGFRNQNSTIYQYIKPYLTSVDHWFWAEATFDRGWVGLFINGIQVYSGQIFPYGDPVGNISSITIGGAHPFLQNNRTFPNSNPLNASLANFVVMNGTLSLNELQNPQSVINGIPLNHDLVFYAWTKIN